MAESTEYSGAQNWNALPKWHVANIRELALILRVHGTASRTPRPTGSKQVRKVVHELFFKAGLLKPPRGRMYNLRVHSLRKFFKTQLLSLGVQESYVDYMVGHVMDVYHDVEMKRVEFLRNVYASAGLSIRPKTKMGQIEALKEIIRAWGMNPEQVLARDALTRGATVYVNSETRMTNEVQILSRTLRELIQQDSSNGEQHQ